VNKDIHKFRGLNQTFGSKHFRGPHKQEQHENVIKFYKQTKIMYFAIANTNINLTLQKHFTSTKQKDAANSTKHMMTINKQPSRHQKSYLQHLNLPSSGLDKTGLHYLRALCCWSSISSHFGPCHSKI